MNTLANPAARAMPMIGAVTGVPQIVLRLAGAIVLAASSFAYSKRDGGWTTFAFMFFVPDVSMLGYIGGRRATYMSIRQLSTTLRPSVFASQDP